MSDQATLLPTKLTPPRLSISLPRARLHTLLDNDEHALTLVFGSPGAGATTLVASWLRRRKRPYCWLSVDSGDNDPSRFWRHLVESLRGLNPAAGVDSMASFAQDPTSFEHLSLLSRDLRDLPPGSVVVVDDLDVLDAEPVVAALDYLARHVPAGVRVVATAHTNACPGLARLRGQGLLVEIGPRQLRFTAAEVRDLLPLLGVGGAAPDHAAQVAQLTEGWAMGVRLVGHALAASEHEDSQVLLATATAAATDFLGTEVLDRQQPAMREFLLATSVLDTLTPDLCRRVAVRADAGAVLRTLAARNLFVVSTGPGAYRYHSMFRTALVNRLEDRDPAATRVLRARTADCLAADGDLAGALAYYAAAQRYDDALSLIAWRAVDALQYQPSGPAFANLADRFPADYMLADPCRRYALTAYELAHRDLGEPSGDRLPRPRPSNGGARQLADERGALLHAVAAGLREDTGTLLGTPARLGQTLVHQRDGTDADIRYPWLRVLDRALVGLLPGLRLCAYLQEGNLGAALAAAGSLARVGPRGVVEGVVNPGVLARVALAEGHLNRAQRLSAGAFAQRFDRLDDVALLDALAVRGALLLQRNELVPADHALRDAVRLANRRGAALTAFWCEMELARTQFARGLVTDALDRMTSIGTRMRAADVPVALRRRRLAGEIVMRIGVGQVTQAPGLIDRLPPELAAPLRVRLALSTGDLTAAAAHLDTLRPETHRQRIEHQVLRARVSGRVRSVAMANLRPAIEEARSDGYVRAFLDEGPAVHRLLRAFHAESPDPYLRMLAAAADAEPVRVMPHRDRACVEPLTRRERQVLRYLATALPYEQIAAELFVSRNTVKKHVQHIYRKLCVQNRQEAVAVGRNCGLL